MKMPIFVVVMVKMLDDWLGVLRHSLVPHVVDRRLLFVVFSDDLDDEVWIGRHSELLEAHINVRIHRLVIFELFPSEETVVFALVFNLVLFLVFEILLNGRFFNLFLQCLSLSEFLLLERCKFWLATRKATV